ncbi:MAG: hypothetical protein B7Y31_02880 [Novosphingobium sp. 16-62-11]|nr:MAG: hypothetical protein B7Y31_02880 [Novosphingobium sp. 16-62-11]
MCAHHYNEKRRANMRCCADCGKTLYKRRTAPKDGLCQPCRTIRNARTCRECGAKHTDHARKSGRCNICQRKSISLRSRIGEDRLRDYYLLRQRGMSRDQAVAHIEAGLPVVRKIGNCVPKITTMHAVQMAGEALAITPEEILSTSRFTAAVDCRAIVAVVMSRNGVSLAQIGRRLNRDHTSILHLRQTFPKRAAQRPALAKIVETIMEAA